jgi:methionyl-tRNA synthetase
MDFYPCDNILLMTYIIGAHHYVIASGWLSLLIALAVWELVWKGLALWRAGKNKQLAWFVVMLVLNTAGILEIIYLVFFSHKQLKKS